MEQMFFLDNFCRQLFTVQEFLRTLKVKATAQIPFINFFFQTNELTRTYFRNILFEKTSFTFTFSAYSSNESLFYCTILHKHSILIITKANIFNDFFFAMNQLKINEWIICIWLCKWFFFWFYTASKNLKLKLVVNFPHRFFTRRSLNPNLTAYSTVDIDVLLSMHR